MINKTKDLFNTASKKVADFFTSNYMEEQNPAGREPNIDMRGDPEANLDMQKKSIFRRIKDAFKDAGKDSYANRVQTYNQYLKTLNSYKGFKTNLSGRVGNLGMMSPGSARKIARPDQTSYEQKLGEWNRRMREFSIRRYYASLGKRK